MFPSKRVMKGCAWQLILIHYLKPTPPTPPSLSSHLIRPLTFVLLQSQLANTWTCDVAGTVARTGGNSLVQRWVTFKDADFSFVVVLISACSLSVSDYSVHSGIHNVLLYTTLLCSTPLTFLPIPTFRVLGIPTRLPLGI